MDGSDVFSYLSARFRQGYGLFLNGGVVRKLETISQNRVVIFIAVMWILFGFPRTEQGATLTGKLHPVVIPYIPTTVYRTEYNGVESSRLVGTISKVRGVECAFNSIEWYLQDGAGNRTPVFSFFRDKAELTTLGEFNRDYLIVGIEPERLDQTIAYVNHACWVLFSALPVKSLFFKGTEIL